jgi:hypothetical protein
VRDGIVIGVLLVQFTAKLRSMTIDLAVDSLDLSLLPSSIQLLRCTACRRFGGRRARLVVRPSGPLVGGLRVGAHGSGDLSWNPDTRRRLEDRACEPSGESRWFRGFSGGPEVFSLLLGR